MVLFNNTARGLRSSGSVTVSSYLPAWQVEHIGQTVLFCRYCRCYHLHGIGSTGHRVAHCHVAGSPYSRTDYVLVDAGAAPPAIVADLDRQFARHWPFRRQRAAAEYCFVDADGAVRRLETPEAIVRIRAHGADLRVVEAG